MGVAQPGQPAVRVVRRLVEMYWSAASGQAVVSVRASRRYASAPITSTSTMTPATRREPGRGPLAGPAG